MTSSDTEPFTPSGLDSDFATPGEWAQLYRLRGIQVVPAFMPSEVKQGASWKRPLLKSWTEYQEALVPDEVFAAWYGADGLYVTRLNMGIITGRASNNLFVIDLDHHKFAQAATWWNNLMLIHNNNMDLETVEQRTGGGGGQKLFRAPPGWTAPTNKTPIGVDIRGQGGFAMLAPSLHDSGNRYEWLDGKSPDDIPVTMAPDWLLEAVEALVRQHGGTSAPNGKTHQTPPQSDYDAFGHQTDGREDKMFRMVWAAMRRWCQDRRDFPSDAEHRERAAAEYTVYMDTVGLQQQHPAGMTMIDMLTAEGRGPDVWWQKWRQAAKKWHGELAEDAAEPDRHPEEERTKRDNKYQNFDDEFNEQTAKSPTAGPPPPIKWLDMSNWDNISVPTRKWAIRDRVPLNQVGLFSGEGGGGKSIIELMKDVAHVIGGEWLGSMPEQGGAFYLGAEDEADEIHIRLAAIAKNAGTTFKALIAGGLKVLPLLGEDSMLCVQVGRGNHIECTPLYRQLYEAAGDLKPKNISIDTLSRAFGGDEINRVQVYAFAMHMQAIAKVAQGSVTILSHPSLAGIASGSGISGSTAWHGAFRFRQYLKGIKDEDDDGLPNDLRQLEFKKNQYGPSERPIILRYVDGLFLPVNGATDPERIAREARVDGLFVKLLRRFNERLDRVTHLAASQNYYAPKVFAEEPEAKQQGIRKLELEEAMKRLLATKRVLVEIYRRDGRSQSRLVLAPGT